MECYRVLALGPVLVNIFINCLDKGREWVPIKIADDTDAGGVVNTLEDRIRIRDGQANKFSWENCDVLHLSRKIKMHKYRIGYSSLAVVHVKLIKLFL